jgi:hypothetical protein
MTCSECKHFSRCQFLLQRTGEETECDWEPSLFLAEGAIHLDEPDTEDEVLALVEARP